MESAGNNITVDSSLIAPQPEMVRKGCLRLLLRIWTILLALTFIGGGLSVLYLVFPPPAVNILILGFDTQNIHRLGGSPSPDSITLANIDPEEFRVSILSLSGISYFLDSAWEEVSSANMKNLYRRIENSFGIRIDYSVNLGYGDFVNLVDSVGGVDVYVERVTENPEYPGEEGIPMPIRFESGLQHMDGARALVYSRTLHNEEPIQRNERQQQVMSAIGMSLSNPRFWIGVWSNVIQDMDSNITMGDILQLAPPVIMNRGRFESMVLDTNALSDGPNEDVMDWVSKNFR